MTGRLPVDRSKRGVFDSSAVVALIVTFHPKQAAFQALIDAMSKQVGQLLIIDNSTQPLRWLEDVSRRQPGCDRAAVEVVALGKNTGIAAAQNIGIQIALDRGFRYVLFSDQDSIPSADMVATLVATCKELERGSVRVGAVCPAYYDTTTGQHHGFQARTPGRLFYRSVQPTAALPWIELYTCISSGTLVPCSVLKVVGGMREEFFIDDVDTEWCHRARSMGYRLFGTGQTTLRHSLGDRSFRVWWGGWRMHSGYPPERVYYRFRNFVLMCRLPHVPWRWIVRSCWYWAGNVYAYCLFSPDRANNAKAIVKGLWDGCRGRGGPLRGESWGRD